MAPTSADRPVTVPALWAVSGCSIFIASRTTTSSPASTTWPSSTAILTMVPCIGEVSESPDAAARRPSCRRPRRGAAFAAAGAATGGAEPGGQHDLEALAADLDDDGLALAGVSAASPAAPANGGMVLSNSVSIQRVWTVNGWSRVGRRERRVGHDGAVERDRGGHALDDELVERAARALERLLAGGAGDDQLGEQRVEVAADHVAGHDTGVEADARTGRRLATR